MISCRYLEQCEISVWLPRLFSILHENMSAIAPTGNPYEEDYALWSGAVASALEQEAARMDNGLCARYGGDEFAMAGFFTGLSENVEAVRERIENYARQYAGEKPYRISASIGGCISRKAEFHPPLEQMLEEADRALYRDKTERRTARE